MAVNTTFEIFQQLLRDAVNADASLTSTLKASMSLRVDAMSKDELHRLGPSEAGSVAGNVSLDLANNAILVATGTPATPNRVEFDLITFATPVDVLGTDGPSGMMVGHTGNAADAAVATSDITFQYRLATTDAWVAFTRNTVLSGISTVQFAADIADQVANLSVPQLWFKASQL